MWPREVATASPWPRAAWIAPGDPERPVGLDELAVRWLGTAGFELRSAGATVLIDPFFSRPALARVLTRPLVPDAAALDRYMRGVDAVFVGHSHYDHLLDAPAIARRTGARFFGSEASVRIARLAGVPADRLRALAAGAGVTVGDLEIRAIASSHSRLFTQCLVGGAMPDHAHLPLRFFEYKNDRVFGFRIAWRGRTVYHNGSADLDDGAARGEPVDLLLQCIAGWTVSPRLFERLGAALSPSAILPMHHDDYFRPLDAPFREIPGVRLDRAIAAIRRDLAPSAVIRSGLLEEVRLKALH